MMIIHCIILAVPCFRYKNIILLCMDSYCSGFKQLKSHYHTILHLMPDNYEMTVGKLQNYISDDQICAILSSSNSTAANKMILDCLIEKISCKEGLLDLCHQLEIISTSRDMNTMINKIRSG